MLHLTKLETRTMGTPQAKRYVSTSEMSVIILQGALIYGRSMNANPRDSSREDKDWADWSKLYPQAVAMAAQLQTDAFEHAMGLSS